MTDRHAIGRRSKAKGKTFERTIATMLRKAGIECKRGWQARDGADAADLEGTPWRIECGTGKQVNPLRKLEQCEADAKDAGDTRPCVAVCRVFGSPEITATIRLCCACEDCNSADDLDPVTMPVEAWVKRVVRAVKDQPTSTHAPDHNGGEGT